MRMAESNKDGEKLLYCRINWTELSQKSRANLRVDFPGVV